MVSGSTRQDRSTQLLHGVLDMCLMAVIREEPSYGYEMARKLSQRGLGVASEGFTYRILCRRLPAGVIGRCLVTRYDGPARQYDTKTRTGRRRPPQWVGW